MIGPIIVGVDGSEHARRALNFAIEIARGCKQKIVLVAGVEFHLSGIQSPRQIEIAESETVAQLAHVESEVLEPLAQRCRILEIDVEVRAVKGSPAKALLLTAQETGASHIVLGRRGSSAWTSLLIGSVASHVSQASPVPVTLVP